MHDTRAIRSHFGWFKRRRQLQLDEVTVVDRGMLRKAVGAAALGNAMEWFDFGVYGYLAVTLGQVFFPSSNPTAQLIATFATFTVAFLVRPIGGMVFGPLGDRYGRQKVLAATMILMALGTFSIGLIPSYAQIGLWAPALLLLARLLQGFSTGGEYGGAATFIAEYATDRNRGLMGSWLEFGTLGGYIAGAATVTALHMALSQAQMLDWGWRVPFLVAGPLGLLGLYMRMKLEETPAFRAYTEQSEQRERETAGQGLMTLLRLHWPQLLKCVGLVLVFNVTDYMLLTYMPSYLSVTMGYAESKGLLLIILVMLVMMPLNVVGGMFSDKLGRRPMIIGACVALFALAIPCLLLIGSGSDLLIFTGLMLLGLALVCFTSSMPSTLPALFYTPVRYSALSIAFNVSVSLFGGTTPLVTAWLVERTGDPLVPAYYLMGAAAIGLVTMLFVRETAGLPLRGSPPAVASDAEARALLQGDSPVTVDAQLPLSGTPSVGQPRPA
ncbi:glycine betaine/L-proline transporter ProP [Xanthomonas campestris pv. raphani]|uniref:glycine betaine/L-proline transporter ProP n=1 Tax=Xanthomonas campestris TaxID=339 RepID=UPI002366C3D0|nr:glycine betaine/L-proline transporter ProP [Xanthomonas campestris]MEB2183136.1 glycine betaine/L-proline transporter ProP [Xanthomonas campestris pv. campestris]MEA9783838.1 glycine betaine/L-proline transporter ProP [Xanthomonas campestris pv. raphani]MEA9792160.1 glycine betaine/L-proline transporter ProP [Xanthomonas campestris pv. raphani]MEA9803732.1 glycine betaine/L-proline transporter ProP [Xanthomonas campestris pv. raphani]MEA9820237.1 glycine betaine/L-proline transporter ProP [